MQTWGVSVGKTQWGRGACVSEEYTEGRQSVDPKWMNTSTFTNDIQQITYSVISCIFQSLDRKFLWLLCALCLECLFKGFRLCIWKMRKILQQSFIFPSPELLCECWCIHSVRTRGLGAFYVSFPAMGSHLHMVSFSFLPLNSIFNLPLTFENPSTSNGAGIRFPSVQA